MNPLVSIIIPTFNREGRTIRALKSVLQQSGDFGVEILVVDDASTDGTGPAVERWLARNADAAATRDRACVQIVGWRVSRHESNRGPSAARNTGLRTASGKYLAFLDSDDEWFESSLSSRVSALETNPDIDIVWCDFENVHRGSVREKSFMATRFAAKALQWEPRNGNVCVATNFFDCQLQQPLTQTSTLVLRRHSLRQKDLFEEQLRLAEDWEYVLRLSSKMRVAYLDRVLVRRHIEEDGLTTNQAPWFKANIDVAKIVLSDCHLTREQREFLQNRMTDDLFEWGSHLVSAGQHGKAVDLLLKALRRRVTWRTTRELAKATLGKLCMLPTSCAGRGLA